MRIESGEWRVEGKISHERREEGAVDTVDDSRPLAVVDTQHTEQNIYLGIQEYSRATWRGATRKHPTRVSSGVSLTVEYVQIRSVPSK